ncbi:MICOS complex subunit MIC19 isoform X2 [Prionailurus viverrinus]|uniref:MICOS complex subunit MIC19 isoform X2 n=1 Tax=Prionailurus viverrinus TaxID=61388 RepID=UPI001FF49CD1|nr:MICOS complex subunit MIC19 isoform X2 [Prionailurus viverrinus]
MGGTSSTRRVTFEADENENITVVKGIRLSENVIDRMKETSPSGSKSQRYSGAYGASVSDEELKRRVAEELALEQAKKESENQKRLKQSKELDRERAFANEQLTRAILRERISSEEERAKAKHLAKQLEEKDRVIKKQDAFYKEQLARLEERSSEFYKVTTEQYQKAAEEVEAKFNSYAAVHHRRSFCMLPDKIYMMLSKKACPAISRYSSISLIHMIKSEISFCFKAE